MCVRTTAKVFVLRLILAGQLLVSELSRCNAILLLKTLDEVRLAAESNAVRDLRNIVAFGSQQIGGTF